MKVLQKKSLTLDVILLFGAENIITVILTTRKATYCAIVKAIKLMEVRGYSACGKDRTTSLTLIVSIHAAVREVQL